MSKHSASPRLLLNAAIFVAASLLIAPLPAIAETMTLTQTADQNQLVQSSSQVTSLKKVRLALDNDGNVMVHFGGVSVTFIYEASGSPQENRTQSGNSASRQEVACLGGLSIKLGVTF